MPVNPKPLKVVLLTRSGRPSGEMILQALAAAGKTVSGVVVEPRSRLVIGKGVIGMLKDSIGRLGVRFLWSRVMDAFTHACRGRGESLRRTCERADIRHFVVKEHNSAEAQAVIRSLDPDVIVTANTRIITEPVIGLARMAAVNVHTGKLPEYAGLDSIFWALYRDESEIGVTVHYLTRELDAGDILLQALMPVGPGDDLDSLTRKAHARGAQLVVEAVDRFERGCIQSLPQDRSRRSCFSWPTPAQRRELGKKLRHRKPWHARPTGG